DLVLPYAALQRGDESTVIAMLSAIRNVVPEPSLLKVILETGELVDPILIDRAAHLAIAAGADFIKTSTGKTRTSATPQAVTIMLATIRASGRAVGLKPSGGIKTVDDALEYLQLADAVMGQDWATPQTFRFGASGLLDAVESELA
ncbi:MAG: deoxyribose-phosphate aldolase, partial [Actinobacteria bacterium]|nr:deoxyribose-phosphate aldolase [Actinomycetota bacterium]